MSGYPNGDRHWSRRRPGIVPHGDAHYKRDGRSVEDRFWSRVEKADGDGCWNWNGYVGPSGYGIFHVGRKSEGTLKPVRAHRLSWQLAGRMLEDGKFVLHRCDNPRCVRPSHLFLGSPADNSADMVAKGRQAFGESASKAKLTTQIVRAILEQHAGGRTAADLARSYVVSPTTVQRILLGKTWRFITRS